LTCRYIIVVVIVKENIKFYRYIEINMSQDISIIDLTNKNAGYKCEIWIYNEKKEKIKIYN
jgi:hypothetical protein